LSLTLLLSLVNCSSPSETLRAPAPPVAFSVGRTWTYEFRDSVVSGAPLEEPLTTSVTVRVLRDTLINGVTWFIVENGRVFHGGIFDSSSAPMVFFSDRSGVWWRVEALGRSASILILPAARKDLRTQSWLVTASGVPQQSPAGSVQTFAYRRFDGDETMYFAPEVGLVRGEQGIVDEFRRDGTLLRRKMAVRYLVASSAAIR
jgi:hypothetical protein